MVSNLQHQFNESLKLLKQSNESYLRHLKTYSAEYVPDDPFNMFTVIDKIIRLGRVALIVVDGKAQTGKSTTAQYVCEHYDKDYVTVFTIEELTKYLDYATVNNIKNRWIFFDEPQLQSPRATWWSEKNQALQAITSSYGFLKSHMIMALPNLKGISNIVLTNLCMRITMRSYLTADGIVKYVAFVKLPQYSEYHRRWYFYTMEERTMPNLIQSDEYFVRKKENFRNMLDDQLKKISKGSHTTRSDSPEIQAVRTRLIELKNGFSNGNYSGQEWRDKQNEYAELKTKLGRMSNIP